MKQQTTALAALVGILFLALAGCRTASTPDRAAPSAVVETLTGTVIDPADQRGKVVVLDFWATWCGPCHLSMPIFQALHDRYADQGLVVLGISNENREAVAAFAKESKITYPLAADPSDATNQAYQVTALPTTVVIDKKGIIRLYEEGFDPSATEARLEALVKQLLAEK